SDHNRNQQAQTGRHDHFALSGGGTDVDTGRVVRFGCPLHDSLDFTELTADLLDHCAGGAADSFHRHGTEHERQHHPHEDADEHLRVHDGDVVEPYEVGHRRPLHRSDEPLLQKFGE